MRATQAPHVSEIEQANHNQRHSYAGGEKQQFAPNSHIRNLATKKHKKHKWLSRFSAFYAFSRYIFCMVIVTIGLSPAVRLYETQ